MTDVYASLKTSVVVLNPIANTSAPAGSLYLDSLNSNALSTKTTAGENQQLGTTTVTSLQIKFKKNMTVSPIAAYKRVALHADGSVVLADSDNLSAMTDIGITIDPIASGATGRVLLNGANADGVLAGLGYTPGQLVYLSKTPGELTNNVAIFNPETDTIMKVGIADCPGGEATGVATDLIMEVEVISQP